MTYSKADMHGITTVLFKPEKEDWNRNQTQLQRLQWLGGWGDNTSVPLLKGRNYSRASAVKKCDLAIQRQDFSTLLGPFSSSKAVLRVAVIISCGKGAGPLALGQGPLDSSRWTTHQPVCVCVCRNGQSGTHTESENLYHPKMYSLCHNSCYLLLFFLKQSMKAETYRHTGRHAHSSSADCTYFLNILILLLQSFIHLCIFIMALLVIGKAWVSSGCSSLLPVLLKSWVWSALAFQPYVHIPLEQNFQKREDQASTRSIWSIPLESTNKFTTGWSYTCVKYLENATGVSYKLTPSHI